MRKFTISILAASAAVAIISLARPLPVPPKNNERVQLPDVGQGTLIAIKDGADAGLCPLKHTDVNAEISGFVSRVRVVQQFENASRDKIEAVYTFPLPPDAAVDDMTMQVGERTIRGLIKRKDEARQIYEQAKSKGHVASLLDQQRPNIFTQSVANIAPGAKVTVTISYVETLKYSDGSYEFRFPMVVGPRYIPAHINDGAQISPPVAPKGVRAGHDISVNVALNAALPIDALWTPSHATDTARPAPARASVRLKQEDSIPNKDFILRYSVAGRKIQDAVLTHRDARGGFFTLLLQPPERVTVEDVTPKELVFVLDTSGSMSGFPIEKAKETVLLALDGLYSRDTFNLITFSGDTEILFPRPVPATTQNVQIAKRFLEQRRGGGGTEMMRAIRAALDPSDAQDHMRIVCFMTDGFVGNDLEIIGEVRKHTNARVFAFGIGSSVNHFLLDGIAREGRGEVEYVGLRDNGSEAARRLHERVRNPLLTDIKLDFGGLPVSDVYPARVPDLFSAKPVVVTGRFAAPGKGVVRLSGRMSGRPFLREMPIEFPVQESGNEVLASLWARARIAHVSAEDYAGMQQQRVRRDIEDEITKLGLEYRLMTQFTSFVAVEERVITEGGTPRRVEVPVEMPDGVSHEGVFGSGGGNLMKMMAPMAAASPARATKAERADMAVQPVAVQNPLIASLIERIHNKDAEQEIERKFVRYGKAYVEVWLDDTSPATMERLRKLGFEKTETSSFSKVVIGRVPLEKLEALTKLEGVKTVAPHMVFIH